MNREQKLEAIAAKCWELLALAACLGPAEAGWRATLAAIETLQEIRRHYGDINIMLHAILDEKEEQIISAWEGQY